MPHGTLHKKKLKKNLLALAIIFGLCALIWAVTIIRMSTGSKKNEAPQQTEQSVTIEEGLTLSPSTGTEEE